MAIDKLKDKADEIGDKLSDEYHENVPKKMRIFFWAVVAIVILAVLSFIF